MNKLFACLASAALMTVPVPAIAAPASGPGTTAQGANEELLSYCHELMEEFPDLSLGGCMSFNSTQGTYGFVPQLCAYFDALGLLEDNGFTSFSDCVRNAR